MHISEMQQKIEKYCFVSEMMAFEIIAVNSAYCCKNTCLSAVNVLTNSLKISDQTEADFSNSIYLEITRKEGNSGTVLISPVFGTR